MVKQDLNFIFSIFGIFALILSLVALMPQDYNELQNLPDLFSEDDIPNIDLMHGLCLWLPFDGVVLDKSGFRNDGVNYGASYVAGKFDRALNFSANDYVEIPYNASLWGFSAFTLAVWVKPNTVYINQRILINLRSATLDRFFALQLWNNRWWFSLATSTGETVLNPSVSFPVVGEWTFLVADWNSTCVNLYSNCTLLASGVRDGVLDSVNNVFEVGIYNAVSQPLDGTVDDVRAYNRVLNQDEINALYELP